MNNVLTDDVRIESAVAVLQNRLILLSEDYDEEDWVFPSGDGDSYLTYTVPYNSGKFHVAFPDMWNDRFPNLFSLGKKKEDDFVPNAEINIPEEINRRVGGVFVQDDKGQYILCHRGKFNAFRGGIPMDISKEFFSDELIDVNDGKEITVIKIAYLDSPTLADDIVKFVNKLINLREKYKNEEL